MGKIRYAYDTPSSGKVEPDPRAGSPINQGGSDQSPEVRECLGNSGGGPGKSQVEQEARQEDRRFYVYYLRRPDKSDPFEPEKGQPFYVGKGSNCRYKEHRKEALVLLHKPGPKPIRIKIIYKLWKQGLDFQEDIIFNNLTENEAFEIEIKTIELYGRIDLATGCLANMTNGGEGSSGIIITDEWRKNLSEAHKGLIFTNEHKENLRQSSLGRKLSPEAIEKMRASLIGRNLSEDHKKKIRDSSGGWHHSEKTKQNLREMNLGENNYWYGKKICPEVLERRSEGIKKAWARRKEEGWKPKTGRVCPEETKEKIRKSLKGRKGNPCSEETKEKLRQILKGRAKTEEHKKNLSISARKRHANKIKE